MDFTESVTAQEFVKRDRTRVNIGKVIHVLDKLRIKLFSLSASWLISRSSTTTQVSDIEIRNLFPLLKNNYIELNQ